MGNLLMCVLNPLPITIVGNNIPFKRCPYGSERTIAHDTFLDIVATIVLEREHMFKGRSPTFSLATPDNEWIFLLPKMAFVF
jgi:hypothetical protein